MTSVAGTSRYINAATLANKNGTAAQQPSLISDMGTVDILDIGRSLYGNNGIGLSANARALNKQFLDQTASGFNTVFSLSTSGMGTPETMKQTILALRARLPESQIAESLRGDQVDEKA